MGFVRGRGESGDRRAGDPSGSSALCGGRVRRCERSRRMGRRRPHGGKPRTGSGGMQMNDSAASGGRRSQGIQILRAASGGESDPSDLSEAHFIIFFRIVRTISGLLTARLKSASIFLEAGLVRTQTAARTTRAVPPAFWLRGTSCASRWDSKPIDRGSTSPIGLPGSRRFDRTSALSAFRTAAT